MALHDLSDDIAVPNDESMGSDDYARHFRLPSLKRDTYMGMFADGVYLIGTCVYPRLLSIWLIVMTR